MRGWIRARWGGGERGMRDRWVGEVSMEGEMGGCNGVRTGHHGPACDTSRLNTSLVICLVTQETVDVL